MACTLKKQYEKLLEGRDRRIKGYCKKYVWPEYWKVIGRLLTLRPSGLLIGVIADELVVNVDKKSLVLYCNSVTRSADEFIAYSTTRANLLSFSLIYLRFLAPLLLHRYSSMLLLSEFLPQNFAALEIFKRTGRRVTCIQHGYFPVQNERDIDGLLSDHYILRFKNQSVLLQKAGFQGTITAIARPRKPLISKKSKNIIFVGPGFEHRSDLQNKFIDFVIDSRNKFCVGDFWYRPHPRCNVDTRKLKRHGIGVDASDITGLCSDVRKLFIGVKSTYLLEALDAGHDSLVVEGHGFPKYFSGGEFEETYSMPEAVKRIGIYLEA